MDLKSLSSNWKKLQSKLQGDTKKPALKRKNPDDESTADGNSAKRKKLKPTKPLRKRMGSMLSTEQPAQPSAPSPSSTAPSATLALLAEDKGVPVSAAAVPATPRTDEINAGLANNVTPGKFIALDCEMVGVGPDPDQDSQLARVSIVDYHGAQLYDSFVLPQLPVTDYRTAVSGITPALLRPGYARSFADVQRDVASLLDGRILVGHAIKNDLSALMLSHPKRDIRDTSRHPAFRKLSAGRAPALKRLAKEYLGVDIQGGQHSSVEDARATMLLFRREKDAFEAEHSKKWGRPKTEGAASGGGAKKKKKGKK